MQKKKKKKMGKQGLCLVKYTLKIEQEKMEGDTRKKYVCCCFLLMSGGQTRSKLSFSSGTSGVYKGQLLASTPPLPQVMLRHNLTYVDQLWVDFDPNLQHTQVSFFLLPRSGAILAKYL